MRFKAVYVKKPSQVKTGVINLQQFFSKVLQQGRGWLTDYSITKFNIQLRPKNFFQLVFVRTLSNLYQIW